MVEILRCPICGSIPKVTHTGNDRIISCCGYAETSDGIEGCIRKWNRFVNARNDLMKGGIKREMDILNNYMVNDAINTAVAYGRAAAIMANNKPQIDKVVFNDPATIIMWKDGTKTIVKAQDGEIYDPEKGMALAIAKKFLGNKGNYYNTFEKWLPKEG